VSRAGVTRLLIDYTGVTHEPLTAVGLFELVDGVAAFWPRDIRVASLVRPDQRRPDRFNILVARNRGIESLDFLNETEAVEWLIHAGPQHPQGEGPRGGAGTP
jgi:hypothetical protein